MQEQRERAREREREREIERQTDKQKLVESSNMLTLFWQRNIYG